ncbi:MAG: hypothetical protein OET44_00855 [Gammaproteobacteria bacterium]|nr:hypothetical protein [Gammaproteobacteria bacterium]
MVDTTWQDCAAAHRCGIDKCPHRDRFIGESLVAADGYDEAADEDAQE